MLMGSFSSYACDRFWVNEEVAVRWDTGEIEIGKIQVIVGDKVFVEMSKLDSGISWVPDYKVRTLNGKPNIAVGDKAAIHWDSGKMDFIEVNYLTEGGLVGYRVKSDYNQTTQVDCRKVFKLVNQL